MLKALVSAAETAGAGSAALTFEPHPLRVLRPGSMPPLLCTPADRARLLLASGVARVVELRFDEAMAAVPADSFVRDHLCARGGVRRLYAGPDWRFGRGGAGTVALAREVGAACGMEVVTLPAREMGGAPISSTRIRTALLAGRVGEARALLGRSYALPGRVVRGQGRGAGIGFPTANVAVPSPLVVPARGVYAVHVRAGDRCFGGVANLGVRPTFAGPGSEVLEVHIFDFADDIYGAELRVTFEVRLRGERRFPGVEALRAQIARDVARARKLLAAT